MSKWQVPTVGGIRKVIQTTSTGAASSQQLALLAAEVSRLQTIISQMIAAQNTGGGNIGTTGAQGAAGAAGPPGMPGEDGADGDIGPPGVPGAKGSIGLTGGVGPAGAALYFTAEDGADGDMGPPGIQGPQGLQGLPGAGLPGATGATILPEDGADGDPGPPGAPGPQGLQGAPAMPGAAAYGEMKIVNNASATSLALQNAFYQITGFSLDDYNSFTFANNALTALYGGSYLTVGTFSLASATTSNQIVQIQFFMNGVAISSHNVLLKLTNTSDVDSCTISGIIDGVPAGAVFDVRISCTSNAGQSITVQYANVTIAAVQGATGNTGPQGVPGEDGADGDMGPQGLPGPIGVTGGLGPVGPPVYLEAEQGDEGERGPPGVPGVAGAPGVSGLPGAALYFTAEDGADGDVGPPGLPGPQGPQGLPGTGSSGPAGPPIYLEAEQGDDGERGAPGLTGATGAQGAAGINGAALFFTAEDGIDGDPGPVGPRGLPGAAGAPGIIYPHSMSDGDVDNDAGGLLQGIPSVVGPLTVLGPLIVPYSPSVGNPTQVYTGVENFRSIARTTTSNTLVGDPALTVTCNETGWFQVRAVLFAHQANTTTGGFKLDLQGGTSNISANTFYANFGINSTGGSATSTQFFNPPRAVTSTYTFTALTSGAANPDCFIVDGIVQILTVGTFGVRWAQNTTVGTQATSLDSASYVRLTKFA